MRLRDALIWLLALVVVWPPAAPQGGPDGAVGDTPREAAESLYSWSSVHLEHEAGTPFEEAFTSFDLYRVLDTRTVPPVTHKMAYNPTTETGYDVTEEFETILSIEGAVVATSAAAIKFAKAYVDAGNAEFQPQRAVANSSHQALLGYHVADPSASFALPTWTVSLTSWSPENGVLANWTVAFQLNQIKSAKWNTVATQVGPFNMTHEAHNLRAGVWINNTYSTGHSLVAVNQTATGWVPLALELENLVAGYNRTNFDGSMWQSYYPSSDFPGGLPSATAALVQALVDGAYEAYQNMTSRNGDSNAPCTGTWNPGSNWSFEIRDPDCLLEIRVFQPDAYLVPMHSSAGADFDGNLNVTFTVSLAYPAVAQQGGYLAAGFNESQVARVLMSHEYIHALQYVANSLVPWGPWVEGMAVHAVSLDVPGLEMAPLSYWHDRGSDYMAMPRTFHAHNGLGTGDPIHSYDLCATDGNGVAVIWAGLFLADGGFAAIKEYMRQVDLTAWNSPCRGNQASLVDRTLANVSSPAHTNFSNFFFDASLRMFERNFTWPRANDPAGPIYDLGGNLSTVARATHVDDLVEYSVRGAGMRFVEIAESDAFNITFSSATASGWRARIINMDCEGETTTEEIFRNQTNPVTKDDCLEATVVLNVVRIAENDATFTIDIV